MDQTLVEYVPACRPLRAASLLKATTPSLWHCIARVVPTSALWASADCFGRPAAAMMMPFSFFLFFFSHFVCRAGCRGHTPGYSGGVFFPRVGVGLKHIKDLRPSFARRAQGGPWGLEGQEKGRCSADLTDGCRASCGNSLIIPAIRSSVRLKRRIRTGRSRIV